MKKIFALLLILTLTFTNGIAVLAEQLDIPPADQISSNPNYSSYTWIASTNMGGQAGTNTVGQDGLQIVMAQASISKSGSSITASGETVTNIISDDLGGTICIQRWKNNKWNNYYSHFFLDFDRSSISFSDTVTVESGYYYRVVVSHYANTVYSTVTANSVTQSVYIN